MAEPLNRARLMDTPTDRRPGTVIRPNLEPRGPVQFDASRILSVSALAGKRRRKRGTANEADTASASTTTTSTATAYPAAPFSLIDELEERRDNYAAPETGGTHLKLTLPYKKRLEELCKKVSSGPFGKPPGVYRGCAAAITHGLPIVEAWPETQALLATLQQLSILGDDIDGTIRSEIDRHVQSLTLPPYPVATKLQNVVLHKEVGSHLTTLAGDLSLEYHPFGVVCILETLSTQPINKDHKDEITTYLVKVRKLFSITAWLLNAFIEKLNNPRPGEWNGRRV